MKEICEIMETLMMTSLVEGDKPVSCLLVGPSGGGKSMTVLKYKAPWVHTTTDITSAGLVDLLGPDKTNKIRAIVLPDFNVPLSHKPAVVTLTIANLLSLMSEGTFRIDDARRDKDFNHAPVGIYSGCTPAMFIGQYRKWGQLGLLRRFLCIHFDYGIPTRIEGNRKIRQGKVTTASLTAVNLPLPIEGKGRVFIPQPLALQIESLAGELSRHLGYMIRRDSRTKQTRWAVDKPALEFAPHLSLQTIARAHALRAGKHVVRQLDVEFLVKLLSFTNPSTPGII